jgi:hypothetical protein
MRLSSYDIECLTNAKDLIDKDNSIHHSIYEVARNVGLNATKCKSQLN